MCVSVPVQFAREVGGCASQNRVCFIIVYLHHIFVAADGMLKRACLCCGEGDNILKMPREQITQTVI